MASRGTRDQGGYVLLLKQARWHLPSVQTQERWEGEVVSLGRRLRATPLVLCTRGSSGNQMNTLFRYVHTHFCTPDPMCRTHRPLDSAMSACCVEKRFFARVFSCKCSQLMKKLSHQQPKLQPKRFPFDIVFHNRKLAVNTRMGGGDPRTRPISHPRHLHPHPLSPKRAARRCPPTTTAGWLFIRGAARQDHALPAWTAAKQM